MFWSAPGPSALESAVRLVAPRLFLRFPRATDWADWAHLRGVSSEFLQPWEPTWSRRSLTRSAFHRRLKDQSRERESGDAFSFFLIRQEDEALLGGITISGIIESRCQSGTLGYWIGFPHARQGYMSEALGAVLGYGFRELGLNRLEAACIPTNTASRRLLESHGFQVEGLARNYLRINGCWRDHVLYSLVNAHRRTPDAHDDSVGLADIP